MTQATALMLEGAGRPPNRAISGRNHASLLARALRNQSLADLSLWSAKPFSNQAQHCPVPSPPSRACCFGGQGTEPNEQNTQQSPERGLNMTPQFLQS